MQPNNNKEIKGYNLYNFEPTFREYLSAVIKLSPISIKNYLSDFRFFCGWFEGNSDEDQSAWEDEKSVLKSVTESTIEAYKQYLIDNKLPVKTINRRLSSLRKFGEFALSQGWIDANPARKIRNHGLKDRSKDNEKIAMNEFKSYLNNQHLSDAQIEALTNDVNEFFSIISSQ